jgi:hypothetical protein
MQIRGRTGWTRAFVENVCRELGHRDNFRSVKTIADHEQRRFARRWELVEGVNCGGYVNSRRLQVCVFGLAKALQASE